MSAPPGAFETGKVVLLSAGHFIHATDPAFLAPLIPLLKEKLALSNALAGSLATFLRSSSLVQPFIGYLADRISTRWFVILAPGTSALFMMGGELGRAVGPLIIVGAVGWFGLEGAYVAAVPFSLNYIATGLAAALFGGFADVLGLQSAFSLLAFAPLLALPIALLLPDRPQPPNVRTV